MKRGWKIFWVIVAVLIAFGFICGAIALALGVTTADLNTEFVVQKETSFIGKEIRDTLEKSSRQYEFSDITDLDISVGACEVVIQESNTDSVRVDVSTTGQDISMENDNGTLIIETTRTVDLSDMFYSKRKMAGILKIYVPEDMQFSSADLEFGACDVEISDLDIEQMTLSLGASECNMERMNVQSFIVEVGAGDFEYSGSISGNAEIGCGAGDVELELSGRKEEFNYSLSGGMGEIEIGEMKYGSLAVDKSIDNSAQKSMSIECGMGNVSVDFK